MIYNGTRFEQNDGKLHVNCKHNSDRDQTICDKCLANNEKWYTYWEPIEVNKQEGEQSK